MSYNSSQVNEGDFTLAQQYNDLREDTLYNAGDFAVTTGTAPAYEVTVDSDYAEVAGAKIRVQFHADNPSGTVTIAVNGNPAVEVKKNATQTVLEGEVREDIIAELVFDGTYYQIATVPIEGLPVVANEGDLLYYNGTVWSQRVIGNEGESLVVEDGVPVWGNNMPNVIFSQFARYGYTDDPNWYAYNEALGGGTVYVNLARGFGSFDNYYYRNGNRQRIRYSTINANCNDTDRGVIILGGYIYIVTRDTVNSVWRMYRCLLTNDISSAGNWQQITLSGANFSSSTNLFMAGYDGTNFWFTDVTNSTYFLASLSGTTLTQGSTVAVSGALYAAGSIVNEVGVLNRFTSAPQIRFSDHSGTLDSSKQYQPSLGSVPPGALAIKRTLYLRTFSAFIKLSI